MEKRTRVAVMLAVVLFCFTPTCVNDGHCGDVDEFCRAMGILAETIMTNRQKGISLQAMLDLASKTIKEPDTLALAKNMIMTAYDSPRYMSEESKQEAIEEFRDAGTLACLKGAME